VTDAERDGAELLLALSHEIRSPLVSLRGFTRVLIERWDRLADGDRRELLGQIDHDAARIGRLVDELLDVSRIDAGRFVLRRGPVHLPQLIADVTRRVALAHPHLQVTIDAAEDVPTFDADADRVEQVLTNLVENGAKYATPSQVCVRVTRTAHAVEVAVEDEGPGLQATDRERVFERFAGAPTGRPSGLGLGLWIARSIAEAHGGTLVATGNARGGTTFRLTLPVSAPTD
jgi:signal transduction histidine kinase